MSLVKTILEAYQDDGGMNSDVSLEAYRNATVEGLECDYALLECLTDIVNTQRVVNSADIMGSMTMLLEGTDVSAMMEGVIANAFEKMRHGFLKVKDIVVAWFKKVIDKIISFTKSGKEFVSKYGDILKKKDTKGFEFSGYKWTQKEGDAIVEKACSSIGNKVNGLVGDLAAAADMNYDSMKSKIEGKGVKSDKDYKETVIKDMGISGADSVGTMKSAISKAYRDGKDSSSNLSLTSSQVSEYLDYISSAKDAIKKLKENQSTFEKQLNSVIKTIDTISRKEDRGGDKAKNASNVSTALNTLFTVKRQVHDAQVYGYRSMLKGETGILRRFLNWSPEKKPVQNSYYNDMFADDPMLESDDVIEDEIEECSIGDYAEESASLTEGVDLYSKIEEMLGI